MEAKVEENTKMNTLYNSTIFKDLWQRHVSKFTYIVKVMCNRPFNIMRVWKI